VRTLFGADQQGQTLAEYCEKHVVAMEREVNAWDSDELLRTPDQEVVDYLIQKYSVSCPVLRTQERHRTDHVRADLPIRPPIPGMEFARGAYGPRTVPGTKMTFIVPFDGDIELFFRRQNPFTRFTSAMPEVEIQAGEVRIHWAQPDQEPADAGPGPRRVSGLPGFVK
jgi:hypothetical protein